MARSKPVELVLDCTDVNKARIRLEDGEFIQIEAGVPFKVAPQEVDFLLERSRLARYIKLTEGWSPQDSETRNDTTRGTSDTIEPSNSRADETRGTSNTTEPKETRDDPSRGMQRTPDVETRDDPSRGVARTKYSAVRGVTSVVDEEPEVIDFQSITIDEDNESDPDEE